MPAITMGPETPQYLPSIDLDNNSSSHSIKPTDYETSAMKLSKVDSPANPLPSDAEFHDQPEETVDESTMLTGTPGHSASTSCATPVRLNSSPSRSDKTVESQSNVATDQHTPTLVSDINDETIQQSPTGPITSFAKKEESQSSSSSSAFLPDASSRIAAIITGPVEVNVGGEIFVVGPQCISRSSFLSSIFQPSHSSSVPNDLLRDGSGRLFIDRDANEFKDLIEYLRTGELALTTTGNKNNGSTISMHLRRLRKAFSFYGVPLPPFCSNCMYLYNPELNDSDSCVSHPGLLVQCNGRQSYNCCGQPTEALGCCVSAHEASKAPQNSMESRGPETQTSHPPTDEGLPEDSSHASRPVWRIRPEEGPKMPLVVELGIPSKPTDRLQLESTTLPPVPRRVLPMRPKPDPGKVLLKMTSSSRAAPLAFSRRSSTIQSQDSQKEPPASEEEKQPFSKELTFSSESLHQTEPFDLVCRLSDCPSGQNVELVDLVCDVDLESVDFSCEGNCEGCSDVNLCRYGAASEPSARTPDETSSFPSCTDAARTYNKVEYDEPVVKQRAAPLSPLHEDLIPGGESTSELESDESSPLEQKRRDRSESESESQCFTEPVYLRTRVNSEVVLRTSAAKELISDAEEEKSPDEDDLGMGPCWLYVIQKAQREERGDKDPPECLNKQKKRCEYFKNMHCTLGGRCQFIREASAEELAETEDNVTNITNEGVISNEVNKVEKKKKIRLVGIRSKGSAVNANNPRYKTRMCPLFRAGGCPRSSLECKFAHGLDELRGTSEFYKTQICSFWSAGHCRAGPRCRHAHGIDELRPLDPKTDLSTATSLPLKTRSSIGDTVDQSSPHSPMRPPTRLLNDNTSSPTDSIGKPIPPPPMTSHPSVYQQPTRPLLPPFNASTAPMFAAVSTSRLAAVSASRPPSPAMPFPNVPSTATPASPPNCRIIWFQVAQSNAPTSASATPYQNSPEQQAVYLQNAHPHHNQWPPPIPQPSMRQIVPSNSVGLHELYNTQSSSLPSQHLPFHPSMTATERHRLTSSYHSSIENEASFVASLLPDQSPLNRRHHRPAR